MPICGPHRPIGAACRDLEDFAHGVRHLLKNRFMRLLPQRPPVRFPTPLVAFVSLVGFFAFGPRTLASPADTAPADAPDDVGEVDLDFYLDDDLENAPRFPVSVAPVVDGLRPDSTQIYTGELLRQRGYRTLGEALADIVGVFRSETLSGPRYGMRGVPDGLSLEIDGVPQVVDGERDILDVDRGLSLLEVAQVEVVRGPVSAISGAGALSGIVRVTTRRPGLTGARASATLSSIDLGLPPNANAFDLTAGERHGEVEAQLQLDRFGVFGAATYRQGVRRSYRLEAVPLSFVSVGGTVLPGAKANRQVQGQAEEAITARTGVSYRDPTFGRFFVDLTYARFDVSVPASRLSHGLVDDTPDATKRERATVRAFWDATFGPARVRLAGWAADHARTETLHLFPAAGAFTAGGSAFIESDVTTGGGQAKFDFAVTENHRIRAVGLFDITQQDARVDVTDPVAGARFEDFVTYSDLQSTASGAAEYQGDFEFGLHVTAGGVVRWRTGYPIAFAPRLSLSYAPVSPLMFRVAYAEGSRTPDRYDLAALSQAIVVGNAITARENELLLPEHTRNVEASVVFRPSSRLSLGLDVFGIRHENAIETSRDGLAVFPENLDPRHIVGGEAYAEVEALQDFLRVWTSAYGAWVVEGPALDGNLARWLVAVEATPFDVLRIGGRGRLLHRPFVDGDDLDLRGNAAAGTSAVFDAYLTARPLGDTLMMQVVVENLFDANERWQTENTPFANSELAMPGRGRTVWLRVEGRL